MSTVAFSEEEKASSTPDDADHVSILDEDCNYVDSITDHMKLDTEKIPSTNPNEEKIQEENLNANEPTLEQLDTQIESMTVNEENDKAEDKLVPSNLENTDKEIGNNQNSYSITPISNVLDSPASLHLLREFEKFVVNQIIEKNKTKIDDGIPHDVSENATTTSSSKQKLKNKSVAFLTEIDSTSVNPSKSQRDETEVVVEPPKLLAKGVVVPCRYAHSGCKEFLEKGSMYEQDHYQNCKYRPLQCILGPAVCSEILPYHDYIPHLTQHFLVPTYATEITSSVILSPDDFSQNQHWTPKWFSGYDSHFFANISRTVNGTWTSWVWMLGSIEEADKFAARITFLKGLKCVSEIFPVHSIRVNQEAIEAENTCLLVTDEIMQELSLLGKNFFADFVLNVSLIPHAKELNITTRELRSLTPSRPLKSEKLYVTTIDAADKS